MLRTDKLEFRYPDGPGFTFPDIHCGDGEHLLIIGQSGKGKTTLLHLLAGMLRPVSGAVEINGSKTSAMSDGKLDKFRGQHIGIVFQTAHFVESLSVLDNLLIASFLSGKRASSEVAMKALERLGVGSKYARKPAELSVGEQQRVAIARAIFNNPSIILADEPTSALDDHHAGEVITMLEEQARISGASLIIVTHDKRLKDKFTKQIEI